jgi:hypothetical protein
MLLTFFLITISLLRPRTQATTCASGTLQRSTSASDTSCFHSGDRDTTQASDPARHQQRSVSNLHPTAPPARNKKKPPKKQPQHPRPPKLQRLSSLIGLVFDGGASKTTSSQPTPWLLAARRRRHLLAVKPRAARKQPRQAPEVAYKSAAAAQLESTLMAISTWVQLLPGAQHKQQHAIQTHPELVQGSGLRTQGVRQRPLRRC